MRRLLGKLPGWIRYPLYVVLGAAALVGLIILFEYAGGLLDTGGVVGG